MIHDLHVRGTDGLTLPVLFAPTCWQFAVIAIFGLAAYFVRNAKVVFVVFSLFMCLWLTLGWGSIQTYAEILSTRFLAARVRRLPVLRISFSCTCPGGLPYYLGRAVYLVRVDGHETTSNYVSYSLARYPAWPSNIVSPSRLPAWLAQESRPVYLIARVEQETQLESLASASGAGIQEILPGWWGAPLPPTRAH